MRSLKAGCLVLFLACLASTASAEDGASSQWLYRLEFFTMTDVAGYTPAQIVTDDSDVTYAGRDVPRLMTRFGADVAMEWGWAWVELRPYVHSMSHDGRLRMSLGGIEGWLGVPVYRRFSLGFYHNSAHNFSEGKYGYGTNLNSFFLRTLAADGDLPGFGGQPIKLRLSTEAHVFVGRDGSPYLFARDARVKSDDIGRDSWRLGAALNVDHPVGRVRPTIVTNGDEHWRMASVMMRLPIAARLGPGFIDPLGEHLLVGPYVDFGWNLYRTEEFGSILWAVGVQLDILAADTLTD